MPEHRHRVEVTLDDAAFRRFERMRGSMSKQAYLARAILRSVRQDENARRTPGERRDDRR